MNEPRTRREPVGDRPHEPDAPSTVGSLALSGPAEDEPDLEPLTVEEDPIVVLDDLYRVGLFGLDLVGEATLDPVIDTILDGPRRDDAEVLPLVLTPNVDIVVHLDKHPDSVEAELFRRAQFCLPDGQPLVLVSKLFPGRLQARLPGSDLFARLWPIVVDRSIPVVVVASSEQIALMLGNERPRAGFVIPPMFDAADDDAISSIVDDILAEARVVRPEMVLVGIGNPKDARIIAALLDRWDPELGPRPLSMGLGGSFSLYLGLTHRAPRWIQRIGMEWFYRFLQEPGRLYRRYFVQDLRFIPIVAREWWSRR